MVEIGRVRVKAGNSPIEQKFRLVPTVQPFPVYPEQRTSSDRPGMSQTCQRTKSLRDSPLRGEPDRERGSRGQDRR
jgi:hypothetical protein